MWKVLHLPFEHFPSSSSIPQEAAKDKPSVLVSNLFLPTTAFPFWEEFSRSVPWLWNADLVLGGSVQDDFDGTR